MSEVDSDLFNVDISNYQGSLEVLLDLAKAQKRERDAAGSMH